MKGIYWRPKYVSRSVLIMVALVAAVSAVSVEQFKVRNKQEYFEEKLQASRLMSDAMGRLRGMREAMASYPIETENDPTRSGLVGVASSIITSNLGYLAAKQTTVNPNWAAVVVHMLKKAGVQRGDLVAVGMSGSFPLLNLAVLSACQAMGVRPVVITSAAGSNWGANIPGFSWLEMEDFLTRSARVFPEEFRSVAASLGGVKDRGLGMSKEGKNYLKNLIETTLGIQFLSASDLDAAVDERMAAYEREASGRQYKAYVNVGGGTVSVGTSQGKHAFKPGLNKHLPADAAGFNSVMVKFSSAGVPVIHLTAVKELASRFGLPATPATLPKVGHGEIFEKLEYNLALAAILLGVVLLMLWFFIRMNLGDRIIGGRVSKRDSGPAEPMV